MKAWIDGDIIVYRCGLAADDIFYSVKGMRFDLKKDAKLYCDQMGFDHTFIIKEHKANPLSFALNNMEGVLNDIMDNLQPDGGCIYLSGDTNFREEIATLKPYKGQRNEDSRPCWYDEMRVHLIVEWGAQVADNQEADDLIAIEHMKCFIAGEPSVLVTSDKDLNMIPGWHYDWTKGESTFISWPDADDFFYYQLLMGDPTDNIGGCPRIGKIKAAKLLDGLYTNRQRYEVVRQAYVDAYAKIPGEWDVDKIIKENADLLWIRREPLQEWEVPSEDSQCQGQGEEATAVGEGQAS